MVKVTELDRSPEVIMRTTLTRMALGKRRRRPKQTSKWVAAQDLPRSAAHPFYTRLNHILEKADFDGYVESLCQRFYADEIGRPSLPPGRYFRVLLLGYFEGLDSERAIAWRAADSLSVRSFLGLELHEAPTDHSTGQAAWRPDRDREAVGGGEHVPVGRETLPPGRALLAVGGGF